MNHAKTAPARAAKHKRQGLPQPPESRKGQTIMARNDQNSPVGEKFLSVSEVAELLGTTERFPRRLIEERRIEFKRFGRHVRIAASVLAAYIESCTVAPVRRRRFGKGAA